MAGTNQIVLYQADISMLVPERNRLHVSLADTTMVALRMQDYFSLGQIGLCDAARILFTLFGSYVVLRLMYNRYFHPLRNFPGPIWGSLTDFYKLYIVAQKDAHTRGIAMHKKYGLKLPLP